MPLFTVYRNPNPASRRRVPLLLDVQSELLDDLATRVVVPLVPASQRKAPSVKKLVPTVVVGGQRYLLVTPQWAGVSASHWASLSAITQGIAPKSSRHSICC